MKYNYTIYALINPLTDSVIYVGLSKNVFKRFKQHIDISKKLSSAKNIIINDILSKGQKPILAILDMINTDNIYKAIEIENKWIEFYRLKYDILNKQCNKAAIVTNEMAMKRDTLICLMCGTPCLANSARRKFCSNKCKQSHYRLTK